MIFMITPLLTQGYGSLVRAPILLKNKSSIDFEYLFTKY
jgi:hypothetical protein